jgi:hypothetical protein
MLSTMVSSTSRRLSQEAKHLLNGTFEHVSVIVYRRMFTTLNILNHTLADALETTACTLAAERNKAKTHTHTHKQNNKTSWSESASELYRPSDRRLSAKRLPTFADKGCHVVSVTDPYGRIPCFLDRSRYFSIK